jgi:hypothetical protein
MHGWTALQNMAKRPMHGLVQTFLTFFGKRYSCFPYHVFQKSVITFSGISAASEALCTMWVSPTTAFAVCDEETARHAGFDSGRVGACVCVCCCVATQAGPTVAVFVLHADPATVERRACAAAASQSPLYSEGGKVRLTCLEGVWLPDCSVVDGAFCATNAQRLAQDASGASPPSVSHVEGDCRPGYTPLPLARCCADDDPAKLPLPFVWRSEPGAWLLSLKPAYGSLVCI